MRAASGPQRAGRGTPFDVAKGEGEGGGRGPGEGGVPIAPDLLAEAEAALRRAAGITVASPVRRATAVRVLAAVRRLGVDEREFLARIRRGDPAAMEVLVESAIVRETYFLRHPEQFAALRRELIEPAQRERPLSFWSAGCATGEEPYSLAMTLLDAGRAGAKDRIVATDVSGAALAVARDGVYGEWSLRGVGDDVRRRHFEIDGERMVVAKAVRARVEILRNDLTHDDPPGAGFDAILCRNVLMYFDRDVAVRVLRRIVEATRPGGLVVLAPVEMSLASSLPVEWIEIEGGALLRRPGGARRPGSARARDASPPARAEAPRSPDPRSRVEARPASGAGGAGPEAPASAALEIARDAARRGDVDRAERLAREVAQGEALPEAYLLLASALEAKGDPGAAVEAVRRALYIDPKLAAGHAALVTLSERLGRPQDAERARRNALALLRGLDDGQVLRGIESVTAGALRRALEAGAPGRGRAGP